MERECNNEVLGVDGACWRFYSRVKSSDSVAGLVLLTGASFIGFRVAERVVWGEGDLSRNRNRFVIVRGQFRCFGSGLKLLK